MAENFFEQYGFENDETDAITQDAPTSGPKNYFSVFDSEPDNVTVVTKSPPAVTPPEQSFEEVPGVSWVDTAYEKMNRDNAERKRKEKEALDTKRGNSFLEGITDPQQYGEVLKGPASGVVSLYGTALKAGAGIQQSSVLASQKDAQRQLAMFDRIDAGEDITPESGFEIDVMAYKGMTPEQRQAYRQQLAGFAEGPSKLTAERPLFKAGESVTEFSKSILPAAPGYEESTGRMVGEGLGSLIGGLSVAWLLGPTAAGGVFSAAGSGEALERAVQFDKAERKAGRPGLTEDQITTAALLGVGPGLTDIAPVELLLGRLRIPKPFQKVFAKAIGRIGGQVFLEGFQEGGQQFLQNLIAQEIYNPDQSLTEGVLPNTALGGTVGGIAQTAKETAKVLAKSFAGKRSGGGQQTPPEDLTLEEIAEAIDNPMDQGQQVARETKEDRLHVAEQPAEGAQETQAAPETAVVDPETVAQPEGVAPATPQAEQSDIEGVRQWAKEQYGPSAKVSRYGKQYSIGIEVDGVTDYVTPDGGVNEAQLAELGYDGRQVAEAEPAALPITPEELQAAEQEFILPAIEEVDSEIGSPVIAEAYGKLTADEKAELIERIRDDGDQIADVIEEFAVRNEDLPTIAAMAMRRGATPEQIEQLRSVIQQASPELAGVFDELVASLPKPRQARARTPEPKLSDAAKSAVSTLEAQTSQADLTRTIAELGGQVSVSDWKTIARNVTGRNFPSGKQARDAVHTYYSDQRLIDERVEGVKRLFGRGEQQAEAAPQRQFAQNVQEIAEGLSTPPLGRKVAIAQVYDAYGQKHADAGSLEQFKQRLLEANKEQLIRLSPLDDPSVIDSDLRERSQISTQYVRYHFVEKGYSPPASAQEETQGVEAAPQRSPSELRQSFASILNSKTPKSKWASELGVTDAELEPLIDEAVRKGFLRRDKNGNVRRVPKSQRSGSFAAMAIPDNLPDTLPGDGDVALTPEAEEVWPEAKAAINRAASAILPDAVSIDVRDNIAIATLRKEDQMLALREEAAFQRWFGDSKIVDENGDPLVVYHGTSKNIDAFEIGRETGRYGENQIPGIYLTPSQDAAEFFSKVPMRQSFTIPLYASLQNPYVSRNIGTAKSEIEVESGAELAKKLKELGYDGVILTAGSAYHGGVVKEIIAFEPTQIKSAIGNRGTFDPTDPRISYALRKTKPSESAIDEDASENRVDTGREGVETGEGQPAPGGTALEGEGIQAPPSDDLAAGLPDRALARIIRQESASLDADGNIIAGRPSRSAKASAKGGEGVAIQRAGKVEPFDIAGFEGRVRAEKLSDRDAREGNLARLTYEVRELGQSSVVPLGEMEITQRSDGAWEVGYVEIRAPRNGIGTRLYDAVEKDLGVRMSPSGVLSESGHAFWQKRSPASVQWHVKTPTFTDEAGKMYFSPRKITDEMDRIGRELKTLSAGAGWAMKLSPGERETFRKAYVKERGQLIALYGKLPLEARAAKDSMFALRAFHGSPHDFDRFDLSRIGTGEGAQAFGHGLYFSEAEGVAGHYRDALSTGRRGSDAPKFSSIGGELRHVGPDDAHDIAEGGMPALDRRLQKIDDEIASIEASRTFYGDEQADEALGFYQREKAELEALKATGDLSTIKGQLYEVEIDVEPEQLLDWDKSLSEQGDVGEKALAIFNRLGFTDNPKRTVAQVKQIANEKYGSGSFNNVTVSQLLRKAGIPGIRYLDQVSRNAGDGTRNIVLFDDSLVKITKKNGKPVSAEERQGVIDEMMAMRRQPPATQPQALGQTDPYKMQISIAMQAVEAEAKAKGVSTVQEAVRVLRHEAVEFFRAMGLFTEKEWNVLKSAAKRNGWVETTGVREAYESVYKGGMSETELNDLLIKEAIAEQYSEFHLNRKQFKGKVAEVFQRIKDFIDRVANWMKGEGFQTWDDVFTSIDQGEFKARFEEAFPEMAPQQDVEAIAPMTLPGVRELPDAPSPPGPTPGLQPSAAGSLIDIQRNLRRKLGLTVKRGRLDEELKRISALAGTKLQGQYSRQTGVIRLAVLESIDTEAHEVAHALEDRYPLGRLKSAHEATLVGIAQMSGNETASEGFAEFFRLYLTNPQAAEAHAPQFLKDFEAQMQAIDPETLADIQEIRSQYMDWRNASSAGRIIAATKSGVPEGTWAAIRKEYNEGGMAAIGGMYWRYLERVYKGRFDKTNSIRKLTMRIVRQAEKNNQDVDLSAWRNPQMQAQKIGSADGAGTVDIMKGIHWENAAGKGTVSLKAATARAFNGTSYEQWSDEQQTAFGAYLLGRRGRWLWQRFEMDPARNRGRLANAPEFAVDGDWYYDTMKRQRRVMLNGRWETELLYAPDKHNRGDHVQTVVDLEAANPQFAEAAEMVYQFLRDLALKRYQAGLDTLEEYQYKINTPDYVPWFRDMSDEIFKGTAISGRKVAQKFKLRGSYRDFINPVEGIVRQVYDTNHEIAVNKPKLLLAQMAEAVTGAGQYAEIIPATRMKVQEVKIREALMNAAREEGLPPEDAKQMISSVAAMIGDDAVAKLFSQEQAREGRDAIVHYMDGGQLKMLQIHDDGYGIAKDILGFFETVRGTPFGDSFFNMLVSAVRVPQRGITAHVGFLWRNAIRDTYQAAVMMAGYFPIVSNIRTVASNVARRNRGEETWSDIIARHGGIMGGLNRTNIQQLRQGRTSELRTDGVVLQPWRRDFWARTMNPFNEDFWRWAEWSEANARQTLARIAFNRALKDAQQRYPDMPPEQQTFVALESAVQQSRDYTDYGRMGDFASQVVMNRLIMFLGPALQGPDKMIRKLFLAQALDGRFAAAQAVRKQIAPLFNRDTPTRPLTKSEKDALKDALRAWLTVAIIAHTHLLIELLFNDDDELEDKSEMERALNVPLTINGQPYRIPRGFDVVNVASNAVRATYDSWRKEDPTAWRRFRDTLGYSLIPPHSSPLLDLYIGWKHNRNNFFDSDIEPVYMQGKLPGDRYTAYTSKLSRDIADGVNSVSPYEVSPIMVEYTMNTIGSDWARDILRAYDAVDPDKPALRWQEYPFIRTTRGLRGTRGSEDFWNLMGREGEFMQPAGSYKKEAVDDKVWSPREIRKFFEQRVADDDAKAFSVLNGHYDIKQRRLHPMQRAREFIAGLSATARAVASNRIEDPRTDKRVEVSRAVRGQANEIIAEITRREYLNALIALQRPGYEFREPQPVQPYMDELKTISPEIYKVLIDKITNKSGPKVYDYETVRELWPEVRRRLLDQNKIEDIIEETGQVEFRDLAGPAARARAGGIRR